MKPTPINVSSTDLNSAANTLAALFAQLSARLPKKEQHELLILFLTVYHAELGTFNRAWDAFVEAYEADTNVEATLATDEADEPVIVEHGTPAEVCAVSYSAQAEAGNLCGQ